jgi:hypothetical protein
MAESAASAEFSATNVRKLGPIARGARRIAGLWRKLTRTSGDSYRPERHYMRGPGPKWRAQNPRDQG